MRIGKLFGRSEATGGRPPAEFDVDGTFYAIGDIHGMTDLMQGIVQRIREDVVRPSTPSPKTLVFMGDYVDRGEDSKGTLDYLSRLESTDDLTFVFLRGNHDALMLDFVDAPVAHARWLEWGGLQTIASFGIRPILPGASEAELERTGRELGEALGDLREFLETRTVLMYRAGNVVFCHASMTPDLPVEDQSSQTLLWGSRQFMDQGGPPGNWYVHGHTITDEASIVGNRIAVDTGAFGTGILSAARITREGCAFLKHT